MTHKPRNKSPKDHPHSSITPSPQSLTQSTQHGSNNILSSVPYESLAHITATLAPTDLFNLSLVNHALFSHVADDNTWHVAFDWHFLSLSPESDDPLEDDERSIMLRRTEPTWRREFVKRFNLSRRWAKSRSSGISHTPHHSNISSLLLLPDNASLLTSSHSYGIVSRSYPFTGKILKGYLSAEGTPNNNNNHVLGNGNPNAEFSPSVRSISLHSSALSGGTAKIVWGFRNGDIALTVAPKVMELGKSARFTRSRPSEAHLGVGGSVECLAFSNGAGDAVVSGADDGSVKVWDAKRVRCVWTGNMNTILPNSAPAPLVAARDPCVYVAFDVQTGSVVGAARSGTIHVWSGLDISTIIDQPAHLDVQPQLSHRAYVHVPPPVEQCGAPTSLFLQPASDGDLSLHIGVHYAGDAHFYRISVTVSPPTPALDMPSTGYTRAKFGEGPLGPITALKADFASPSTQYNSQSFIFGGDSLGRVSVWAWNEVPKMVKTKEKGEEVVSSCLRWEAHDDGGVNSIAANGVVIVTGSSRGMIKVWDALTLELLRAFPSPHARPLSGDDVAGVSHISLSRDLFVASIGPRVQAWRATPTGSGTKHIKGKGKKHGHVNPTAKWQQHLELRHDLAESRTEIDAERGVRDVTFGRERAQLAALDELGLDEIEATEYILMLSREEAAEEERRRREEQDDLMFDMTETDEGVQGPPPTRSYSSTSRSSSFSSSSSTSFTRAPSWFSPTPIPSPRFSPRPSPSLRGMSTKVQVSPRARPEASEAGGLSMSPLSLGLSSASINEAVAVPTPDTFPSIGTSPSPRTTSFASSSTGSPARRGWSSIVRSSPSPPMTASSSISIPAPINPWSAPRSLGRGPPSSLLTASLTRVPTATPTPPVTAEAEDDELRYVLELSLQEARSRGEAV